MGAREREKEKVLHVRVISANEARAFNEEMEKFLGRADILVERIHLPQPVAVGEHLNFTAYIEFRAV